MSKEIKKIEFEIKAMGINFYISFMFIIFAIITNIILKNKPIIEANTLMTAEIFIPLGAAWLSIFAMKDLTEDEGSEAIYSYPLRKWSFGFVKVLKYLVMYIITIFIYTLIVKTLYKEIMVMSLFLQLTIQSLFMGSFGYTVMIIGKRSSIAISAVGFYIICIGMFGAVVKENFIEKISVMLYNRTTLPLMDMLILSTKTICMTIGLFLLGSINTSGKLK